MAIRIEPVKRQSDPASVPDGVHAATLTNIKQFENSYGARIGFEFTLEGGETVMRSTGPNLSQQSKLAELIRGLLGRNLNEQEMTAGMDVEQLIGTECKVLVRQSTGKNGQSYSNIESVFQ